MPVLATAAMSNTPSGTAMPAAIVVMLGSAFDVTVTVAVEMVVAFELLIVFVVLRVVDLSVRSIITLPGS